MFHVKHRAPQETAALFLRCRALASYAARLGAGGRRRAAKRVRKGAGVTRSAFGRRSASRQARPGRGRCPAKCVRECADALRSTFGRRSACGEVRPRTGGRPPAKHVRGMGWARRAFRGQGVLRPRGFVRVRIGVVLDSFEFALRHVGFVRVRIGAALGSLGAAPNSLGCTFRLR